MLYEKYSTVVGKYSTVDSQEVSKFYSQLRTSDLLCYLSTDVKWHPKLIIQYENV